MKIPPLLILGAVMLVLLLTTLWLGWPIPMVFSATLIPAFAVLFVQSILSRRKIRQWYLDRPTLYREWLSRFGSERREKIQKFLRIYAEAFGVERGIIHKIGPDDGVLDYYHRGYAAGEADALEDVRFARKLKSDFGYEIIETDGTITLGALFEKVIKTG